jgi:hypothetical protein
MLSDLWWVLSAFYFAQINIEHSIFRGKIFIDSVFSRLIIVFTSQDVKTARLDPARLFL